MKENLRDLLKIPNYHAKVLSDIKNKPDEWNSLKVGVFEGEKQVGSYERNYHALSKTFFPFEHKGKWYALVSPDYDHTSLMSLPDCKIIGREPPVKGEGFCPVEFYVPNYVQVKFGNDVNKGEWCYDPLVNVDEDGGWGRHSEPIEVHNFDFGFVAGCVWGDDSSWKVQHLDLSRADEGVITRSEKFGYVELGRNCSLEQSVDVIMFSPTAYRIQLAITKCFYVNPGEAIDYSKYQA